MVGIPPERAGYMLPIAVSEFKKKYPEIQIKTVEAKTENLEEYLLKGQVDFIILPENVSNDMLIDTEVIYQEEIVVAAGDGLLNSTHCKDGYANVIDMEKVKEQPFILLRKGHGIRRKCDSIFNKYNIQPNIVFETASNFTALRLSAFGMGITIVPKMSIDMLRGALRINTYSLDKNPIMWQVIVACRKGVYLDKAEKSFIDILKQNFN